MTRSPAPLRVCRVCERDYPDRGPGSGVPRELCSKQCAARRQRERATARASRRRVPPRPMRLFAASSRDWSEARAKVSAESQCRFCHAGPDGIDAAHIIPRSLAPNGGEEADGIVPLCRSCHRLYDRGELDLLAFLSPAEQAHAVLQAGGLVAALRVITGRRDVTA